MRSSEPDISGKMPVAPLRSCIKLLAYAASGLARARACAPTRHYEVIYKQPPHSNNSIFQLLTWLVSQSQHAPSVHLTMPSVPPILSSVLQKQIPNLKIEFPEVTATTPGQAIAKELAQSAPTLHLQSTDHHEAYIAISLDPDAPFATFPFLSPILHSCQTGLSGANGDIDEEGWTRLTATEQPAAPWIPPKPPRISGPHRYVFLIWVQPEGVTREKVWEMMGWGENVGLGKRIRWDIESFVRKVGLGKIIGGAWFVSS